MLVFKICIYDNIFDLRIFRVKKKNCDSLIFFYFFFIIVSESSRIFFFRKNTLRILSSHNCSKLYGFNLQIML